MKISIVVPVYNVEKYLRECVDSLLQQTVPAYEIILVDDGSKDTSGAICDEYGANYPQIKVVHKENAGLGMARNTGLEHVTGDYVVFMDSDDFCQLDMLEQMVATVEKTGCDTCKSGCNRVDMNGKFIHAETVEPGDFEGVQVQQGLLPRLIGSAPDRRDSVPMSACASMYSMDIIRSHDLRFVSERQWISEDVIFNIYYYSYARHAVLIEYIGYNYRVNPRSLTTSYRADRFEKCLALYQKEREILSELGIYEICRYRLSRQLFNCLRMCFAQYFSESCPLTTKQIRQELNDICGHPQIQKIVGEYPVKELGVRQSTFLHLVKHKCIGLIYAIYRVNLFT